MTAIRIDGWFQGPTGSGQGGWTAHRFVDAIGTDRPLTVALRAAVPLDTDLAVVGGTTSPWVLVDPATDATIMTAEPWMREFADTEPVSIATARAGRSRFAHHGADHPVPYCFSCGAQPDSMHVHGGALDDGRYATDWTVPEWSVLPDGTVDPGVVWAALDCATAWYVCTSRGVRPALTAQFAVELVHPIEAGATYALVGWWGDRSDDWDGRKRHGASAAFAADGTCIARSVSFWLALDA